MQPLISKIDPVLLQKAYRDLRIGIIYGRDLLSDGMFKGNVVKAHQIANKLVSQYPSHGYAIFRHDLKGIGLVVEDLERSLDAPKLNEWYNKINGEVKFIDDIHA